MAEQERLTKAERREQKRLRRLEEERAATEKAQRDRRRNLTYTVSLVAVVGVLVWLAVGNSAQTIDSAITLTRVEVEDAQASASCETLDVDLIEAADVASLGLEGRSHIEPASAPAADQLYPNGRPTASGPHYTTPLPIVNGIRDEPIDERGSTHNLEHGSIIVWIDGDQVDDDAVDDIASWVETLNENGFAENTGRAGIMASYVGESGIDSGHAIAIRGWGVAMDCDDWDRDWANGFVLDNFGPNGIAPEQFTEFPDETLAYGDSGEGEGEEQPSVEPSTDGTTAPEPTADES